MINLLQIIIVIQNFIEFIIFLSNQYFEFLLSYNKKLNITDKPNLNSNGANRLISREFDIRLNENLKFKDSTGYYVYQGFEIF